jgi:hypothetical protein
MPVHAVVPWRTFLNGGILVGYSYLVQQYVIFLVFSQMLIWFQDESSRPKRTLCFLSNRLPFYIFWTVALRSCFSYAKDHFLSLTVLFFTVIYIYPLSDHVGNKKCMQSPEKIRVFSSSSCHLISTRTFGDCQSLMYHLFF